MTEEIKEILDKLKDCVNNPIDIEVDQFTQEAYHILNYFCLDATTNDCKSLLNYITNLQKENTDLKKLCDKYEEEHKTTFETWKKVIVRNEKAIEYIKENLFEENNGCGCEWQQFPNYEDAKTRLLSTLQGGDE